MSSNRKDRQTDATGRLLERYWLPLLGLWALACLPRLYAAWHEPYEPQFLFLTGAAGRFIDLVIAWVILGWLSESSRTGKRGFRHLVIFLGIGASLWVLMGAPVRPLPVESLWKALAVMQAAPGIMVVTLVLAGGVATYILSLWFLAFIDAPFRLKALWSPVAKEPLAPLRVFAASSGFPLFLAALVEALYPDGRSTALSLASVAFECLPAVTFPLVAGTLRANDESESPSHPPFYARAFGAAMGTQFIVLAVLVEFANLSRFATLPPAPSVTIVSTQKEAAQTRIELELRDRRFQFRGFRPIFLRITAKDRGGQGPLYFEVNGKQLPAFAPLPRTKDALRIAVVFPPVPEAAELELYYLTHRVASVK